MQHRLLNDDEKIPNGADYSRDKNGPWFPCLASVGHTVTFAKRFWPRVIKYVRIPLKVKDIIKPTFKYNKKQLPYLQQSIIEYENKIAMLQLLKDMQTTIYNEGSTIHESKTNIVVLIWGEYGCSLCRYNDSCNTCIIAKHAKEEDCGNSPWKSIAKYFDDRADGSRNFFYITDTLINLFKNELSFLKMLQRKYQ
jgi:hypothetical protein